MLGIRTRESGLLGAFNRLEKDAVVLPSDNQGRKVAMSGPATNEIVRNHPNGCSIGLSASSPVPGHDIASFADQLLADYADLGPDFVGDRPGQFSMAIWDPDKSSLYIYRDRIGVPPIFYWRSEEGLAWSTSIAGLLTVGADPEEDPIALGHYQLTGYVQAPRTMVASIRKVPAAHRLSVQPDTMDVTRYWSPTWEPKMEAGSEPEQVESLMIQAIERVTPPVGRLGLLLSSGIDSMGLAAASSRVDGLDVEAFTFTYGDAGGERNEEMAARSAATHLGMRHHTIEIRPVYISEQLEDLITTYEEPISYGIHSARMAPIAERGIKVVMTGAEGATWTTSNVWTTGAVIGQVIGPALAQRARSLADRLPGTPHSIKTLMTIAASTNPERYLNMSQQRLLQLDHAVSLRIDGSQVHEARSDLVRSLECALEGSGAGNAADAYALLGLSSFGPEHLTWWTHRWSDAVGLSARFPLLDFDYVNYLARQKQRDKGKADRRQMAARYVPPELANTKQFPQALPMAEWLGGPLSGWVKSVLTKAEVVAEGTFSWRTVSTCVEDHMSGVGDHSWCIWTVLNFLIWKNTRN